MNILEITVKGWAGVDEVRIVNPPDWMIELFSVENGEGKTSLVEALKNAMGGGTIPSGAIRDGASQAEVEVIFDSASIRCTIARERGRTISVKVRDSETGKMRALPSGHQGFLNEKIGTMLDPSSFATMDRAKRQDLVHGLASDEWIAGRGEKWKAVKSAEEDRTLAGRRVRDIGSVAAVEPADFEDVVVLAAELRDMEADNRRQREALITWNTATDKAKDDYERNQEQIRQEWQREQENRALAIDRIEEERKHLDQIVNKLRIQLAEAEDDLIACNVRSSNLVPPERNAPKPVKFVVQGKPPKVKEKDTGELQARLKGATERNNAATLYARYLERIEERDKAIAEHEASDRAVATARANLAAHDAAATLPDGLKITDEGLTYKGRAMHRMSTGEGYVLAFDIAAQRGQKILVADKAEALGPKSIAAISKLAKDRKMWVILCTRGVPHTAGAYELRAGRVV